MRKKQINEKSNREAISIRIFIIIFAQCLQLKNIKPRIYFEHRIKVNRGNK